MNAEKNRKNDVRHATKLLKTHDFNNLNGAFIHLRHQTENTGIKLSWYFTKNTITTVTPFPGGPNHKLLVANIEKNVEKDNTKQTEESKLFQKKLSSIIDFQHYISC